MNRGGQERSGEWVAVGEVAADLLLVLRVGQVLGAETPANSCSEDSEAPAKSEDDGHAAARIAAASANSIRVARRAVATACQCGAGMLFVRFQAFTVLGATPMVRANFAEPPARSMIC